jgi:hypothetical protein
LGKNSEAAGRDGGRDDECKVNRQSSMVNR